MLVPIYHRTECDECHKNEEGKLNNESKFRCWIMTSIVKSCEQLVNIEHPTLEHRIQKWSKLFVLSFKSRFSLLDIKLHECNY